MKKLLLLAAIFALVFAACDDGSENEGNGTAAKATLTINNQSGYNMINVQYSVGFGNINNGGDVTKNVPVGNRYILFSLQGINGNVQCRTDEVFAVEEGEQNTFTFTINTIVSLANGERKNSLKNLYDALNRAEQTTLTIKNTSFTDITDVVWNNVSFASSQTENTIIAGATVTKDVVPGSGYISFKRKSSPITARNSELIIIAQNDEKEFTFTDNTIIVEINDLIPNLYNSGALRTIQTAVVWFDDAEGEYMQPYYESTYVWYYKDPSEDLPHYMSVNCKAPKNGNKSLAIGSDKSAELILRVNLAKRAKLSFWYASENGYSYNNNNGSSSVKINNNVVLEFRESKNWSFIEFNLEPGMNDIIWGKSDGFNNGYDSPNRHGGYYLSLDDILIYYTE